MSMRYNPDMEPRTIRVNNNNIGLCGALFITFLVLKLTGVIDWSWWWITSPIWIPWAIVGVFLLIIGVGMGTVAFIDHRRRVRYRKRRSMRKQNFLR